MEGKEGGDKEMNTLRKVAMIGIAIIAVYATLAYFGVWFPF